MALAVHWNWGCAGNSAPVVRNRLFFGGWWRCGLGFIALSEVVAKGIFYNRRLANQLRCVVDSQPPGLRSELMVAATRPVAAIET